MSQKERSNPSADVLGEIKRLREASDDSMRAFLEIQERIKKLESYLEVTKDGAVRVKPKSKESS